MAQPPTRDKAEELVRKMEAVFLVDPSGFFPYFDSVYQGGGLTGGAGYRKFYGDNTFWEVKGLYSVLNYKLSKLEQSLRATSMVDCYSAREFGWRDATQVGYLRNQVRTRKKRTWRGSGFQETYVEGGPNTGLCAGCRSRAVWLLRIGTLCRVKAQIRQSKPSILPQRLPV